MIHKAWCSIEEVLCCFPRSSIKFQGHKGKKSPISTRIERFQSVTSAWIHRWIWNDTQSLMQYRRGALLFFKVIHQISRSHGLKNRWFGSNLSKIVSPVAAIKSLRFALFYWIYYIFMSCTGQYWPQQRHVCIYIVFFEVNINKCNWLDYTYCRPCGLPRVSCIYIYIYI